MLVKLHFLTTVNSSSMRFFLVGPCGYVSKGGLGGWRHCLGEPDNVLNPERLKSLSRIFCAKVIIESGPVFWILILKTRRDNCTGTKLFIVEYKKV